MVRKCPICGDSFTPSRKGQWICSIPCATKYVDLMHKGIKVKQVCSVCGNVFYQVEKSQFCSTECRLKALERDYEEREKEKPKQEIDHLTKTMEKCKKLGMSYAEYQKKQTLMMIEERDGQGHKGRKD